MRIAGSDVIYNRPIVATGDGRFDVIHHTNTLDRVIAINTKQDDDGPEVTMLLAHGFDSGQQIVYLSTEASDPGSASVERANYVPLLGHAPFANGDDNLGSARERISSSSTDRRRALTNRASCSSVCKAVSPPALPQRTWPRWAGFRCK